LAKPKKFTFLPENYKKRTRITVDGLAATGQVSPQGTVTHREHWDDSMDAIVTPQPVSLAVANANDSNYKKPKEQEVRFRMTLLNDESYVHLRDIEAALAKVGAVDVARRIVVACGQRPAV
jgi:hypothetical protein